MSNSYTIILLDEFNWDYLNHTKAKTITELSNTLPHSLVMGNIDYMIVIDDCNQHPKELAEELKSKGVVWDSLYYQINNNPSLIPL